MCETHKHLETWKYHGYGGTVSCEVCGQKGYRYLYERSYRKSLKGAIVSRVQHRHKEQQKIILDKICHEGTVGNFNYLDSQKT